ncbi:hypothetical protein LFL96_32070 [Paraburkholderia sp. D15]|uniref:hypothetical protein n=1 Tax=Paraburkholderia sp. D15 TaxID=2880218 RepID=UPI0024787910|nr:hypothetical protein [Paraburkholderia sp. D15]WGS52816.1 hypothetical protein LFL96_32070 [Paraburkholderia sp. D15]WKF61752.1 hypothetical protein HUO10_006284 [Paraburkholderia busanensis]
MKFRHIATAALLAAATCTASAAADSACATLVGGSGATPPQGFRVRNGEPVDLVGNGKTVHGTLLVFGDNGLFRAYWQPENSPEKYVLANAGVDTIRLVSTPPQGTPAQNDEPGTTLAPQRVLSCPAL